MTISAKAQIYEGAWRNWDTSGWSGATLTLPSAKAAILMTFIAVFLKFVGSRFWAIIRFILHQTRIKRRAPDGLHAQQQIMLRNTTSDLGTILETLDLAYHWRKNAACVWRRSFPMSLLAILSLAAWTICGILSPRLIRAYGQGFLVKSSECGFWWNPAWDIYDWNFQVSYAGLLVNRSLDSEFYVKSCYSNVGPNQAGSEQCRSYAQQRIDWKANPNAECPFAKKMCLSGAYEMDTGLMDSHAVFGINARPQDRVGYRRKATCAPVTTKNYKTVVRDNVEKVYFYYGSVGLVNGTAEANFTSVVFAPLGGSLASGGYCSDTGYHLKAVKATAVDWEPIPELKRDDASVSIYFLDQNCLVYQNPVDDPFFSAHQPIPNLSPIYPGSVVYTTDEYGTVLACIDQHQLCNPNNGRCTQLNSTQAHVEYLPGELDLNIRQNYTSLVLLNALFPLPDISDSAVMRNEAVLLAGEAKYRGIYDPGRVLPNNQWTIEVGYWFNIALATLQAGVLQYATGPGILVDPGEKLVYNSPEFYGRTCGVQRVGPGFLGAGEHFESFSIRNLALILTIGALIIVLSFSLETVVGKFQLEGRGLHRKLAWICDGKFQLLRIANEARGAEDKEWLGCTNRVPVTARGVLLAGLDTSNTSHPKLAEHALGPRGYVPRFPNVDSLLNTNEHKGSL